MRYHLIFNLMNAGVNGDDSEHISVPILIQAPECGR